MSRSQESMETTDFAWACASQFQGRDSSAPDAARSSRHYQFETDYFGRRRATTFSNRVREFTREPRNEISDQRRFFVASGPAHKSRTKFGAVSVQWSQ